MPLCKATRTDGKPCKAPQRMLDERGLCPAHRPGARKRLQEAGRKGAAASAEVRRRGIGLLPEELPALKSPHDAACWAEIVGRAVAERRLTHSEGRAISTLLREFLKAHAEGKVADQVERLSQMVSELKGEKLKVVK